MQVLQRSLQHLAHIIPYDTATIFLLEGNHLKIAAQHPSLNDEAEAEPLLPLEAYPLVQQVITAQQTKLIADVRQVANWRPTDPQQPVIAWLGVPLVVRGQSIGLLTLSKQEAGFYRNQEAEVATSFAAQIAAAVQNSRLFDSLRHQALDLAVMADNLAAEKSKLDAIIRHIADGLIVTDDSGTIQMVNPAFEQMFSQPRTTLADRSLTQIEELQRLISAALAEQEQVSIVDLTLSNGRVLKASSTVIQEETRTLGVVTVLRDITREKEVDRMKSEFISTVSHELRTPLTSVLGFAHHIYKIFDRTLISKIATTDSKGQRAIRHIKEELGIIIAEGERLTRLINDVLDIAKMESGKLEWHMAEVSLETVIQTAVTATSALARAKNLSVQVNLVPALPQVWADQDRLGPDDTNLLSKAIKCTERGQIWVGAKTSPVVTARPLAEGSWLPVSIRDTGGGIAPEHLPYVFEKFRQVGDVLTDRPAGTGLGLPICQEIVAQHGGHIWVESEVGQGSNFSFALPLNRGATPTPGLPAEIRGQVFDTLREDETGQLILVVDDEDNIRNLLCHELSEAGYQVIEAADGLEALKRARQEKPDLILLDVMMPGLSGFDVTSVLKGDQSTVNIPILILSIVEDKERGFRRGAEEYLTKPLDVNKLLETIARLLDPSEPKGKRKKVLVIIEDSTVIESLSAEEIAKILEKNINGDR
jgi:PAS domain S-box-containing protein